MLGYEIKSTTNLTLQQNNNQVSFGCLGCFSLFLRSSPSEPDTDLYDRFYSDMLYSFPSNDNLIRIFLANLQTEQPYYEADLKKRAMNSKIITCDHTFKVSKYIGARRGSDNKFVQQFHNLFIVLNDKTWNNKLAIDGNNSIWWNQIFTGAIKGDADQ